jgi:hypothetical protein
MGRTRIARLLCRQPVALLAIYSGLVLLASAATVAVGAPSHAPSAVAIGRHGLAALPAAQSSVAVRDLARQMGPRLSCLSFLCLYVRVRVCVRASVCACHNTKLITHMMAHPRANARASARAHTLTHARTLAARSGHPTGSEPNARPTSIRSRSRGVHPAVPSMAGIVYNPTRVGTAMSTTVRAWHWPVPVECAGVPGVR